MRSFIGAVTVFVILFSVSCSENENALSTVEMQEVRVRNPKMLGLLAVLSGGASLYHDIKLKSPSLKYLSDVFAMSSDSESQLKPTESVPPPNIVYTLIYPPNRSGMNLGTTTEPFFFNADPFRKLNWQTRSKRATESDLPETKTARQAAEDEENGDNGSIGNESEIENGNENGNGNGEESDPSEPATTTTAKPSITTEGTTVSEIPPWSFVPPSILPQPYYPPSPACTCSSFYYRPPQPQRPFHKPFLPLSPEAFPYDFLHGSDSNFHGFDRFPTSFNNIDGYHSPGSAFKPSIPDFFQDRWRSQRQISYPSPFKRVHRKL